MHPGRLFIEATPLLAIVLLGGATVWYGLLEPPVLKYVNLPFPIVTEIVYPGDVVRFRVERCITDTVAHPYLTTRAIVNVDTEETTHLEARAATLKPGCTSDVSGLTSIPVGTKPGQYYVEGITAAQGTIRTRYVAWHTSEFTVVERPPVP